MDHLSLDQIEAYLARTLPAVELLETDRHLRQCAECRKKTLSRKAPRQMASLAAATGSPHLSYEDLEAFAGGTLAGAGREHAITHLGLCAQCREEADDLSAYRREFRPPPAPAASRWWTAMAAIAAMIVIGAGIRMLFQRPVAGDPYAGLVDRAVAAGRVEVAANVLALRGTGAALRGEPGAGFRLISPVGTAVLSVLPEFRWEPAGAEARYTVSVYDSGQQRVEQSPAIAGTHWTPSKPLAAGEVYQWQVRAEAGGRTALAPGAQGPQGLMLVLGAAEASRLKEAARRFPADHLLLGVLYARAGVLDAAEREFAAAGGKGAGLLAFVRGL